MSEFKIRRLDRDYEILPSYGPRFAGVFVDKDTGELWVNADGTQRSALQPKCQTVAGAGTAQGDATAIDEADGWLVNATGGDGTVGVKLPAARAGKSVGLYNAGSGILKVYPATGDDILDGSANAAVSVASHVYCEFYAMDDATWGAFYTAGGTNATLTGTETLTNKTLTSPIIAEINSDLDVVGTVTSSDATTPILATATGKTNTGYLSLTGKTSGSFKILPADATAQVVTLGIAAQTSGACTLTIPDQAGVSKNLAMAFDAPVAAGGTLSVTAALHANKTIALDTAAGSICTLPAATGSGVRFRFVVTVTATSNSHIVKVANASDEMRGYCVQDSDTATAPNIWWAADNDDTITLNRSTTGLAAQGEVIEVEDLVANHWYVRVYSQASGTEATPFSATVA